MGSIVITTIQKPTASVIAFARAASAAGVSCVIVGDRKTPSCEWPDGVEFVGIEQQQEMGFTLAALLPENHYGRKNIGYLKAMSTRGEFIYDTDDDNAPLPNWRVRSDVVSARTCDAAGWVNAYRWFTDKHIWPRGLPLQFVRSALRPETGAAAPIRAPIQQGLANGSPDVDAVWRLLLDEEIVFEPGPSVGLAEGTWCPFNSQSTWWFPAAFPLMYLPSYVSFRMTDIWRSLIAQRCLWPMGSKLVFHGPEVHQDRNEHNLLRDFEQEIPGYLGNDRIRSVLAGLRLAEGETAAGSNLRRCYEALAGERLVEERELALVDAWLHDVRAVTRDLQ